MSEVESTQRPIFIGIGGDSGTGKTTIASAFFSLFGTDHVTSICLDDYHSLDRRERTLVGLTALNPRANNFALLEEQIWALKRGDPVTKPVYDHSDGTFKATEVVAPRDVVIIQGLHPFLVPGIRHAFDLKVWLDPEPELRLRWKVQRDVAKRGYTNEQVLAELEARRPDAEEFIAPQREHADMVIRFYRPDPLTDMGHLNVQLVQRHTLPRLAFDQQLHATEAVRLKLDVLDLDGKQADLIEIDGRITAPAAQLVADNIWAHMDGRHGHIHHVPPRLLGRYEAPARRGHHSDPLALTQLILIHRILSAQRSFLLRVNEHQHEQLATEHGHM